MRKLSAVLKIAPEKGGRTLIYYDSILEVLGIDPASEPDRPLTVTKLIAKKKMSLSARTIDRMIEAGRAAEASEDAA